jgi:N-acetylmuramoyl-L-alanine amidase
MVTLFSSICAKLAKRCGAKIAAILCFCALLGYQPETYAENRANSNNGAALLRAEYLRLRNIDPSGDSPINSGGWRSITNRLYAISQKSSLDEDGISLRIIAAEGYLRLFRSEHSEQDLKRSQALIAQVIDLPNATINQKIDAQFLAVDVALASKRLDQAQKLLQSLEANLQSVEQPLVKGAKVKAYQRLQGIHNGTFKRFLPSRDLEVPRLIKRGTREGGSTAFDAPLIVLDPGHGGVDFGAVSDLGGIEKEITLDIALRVASILRLRHHFRVHLTRDDDIFVPLARRTAFANLKQASVFVSLHVNASERHDASGLEAYYLDNTNDEASTKLAERENGVVSGGAIDDLSFMLSDLIQSGKLEDSILLTRGIESGIKRKIGHESNNLRSLGVKKAPFFVLVGAHAPCSLVEMFFVDNPNDAKMLRSERFRALLASGIAEGIVGFITK